LCPKRRRRRRGDAICRGAVGGRRRLLSGERDNAGLMYSVVPSFGMPLTSVARRIEPSRQPAAAAAALFFLPASPKASRFSHFSPLGDIPLGRGTATCGKKPTTTQRRLCSSPWSQPMRKLDNLNVFRSSPLSLSAAKKLFSPDTSSAPNSSSRRGDGGGNLPPRRNRFPPQKVAPSLSAPAAANPIWQFWSPSGDWIISHRCRPRSCRKRE